MSEIKKENPNKRTIEIVTRWSNAELFLLNTNADAADLPRAVFIREAALGTIIASRRGLTADAKHKLAIAIGLLNEVADPLNGICEQLRQGDIPLESTMHRELYKVVSALGLFHMVLEELQSVSERILQETERP